MEALFKKYFWVVKGLGFAAAVGLAASAISTQIGTRMLLTDLSEGEVESGDTDGETDGEDDGKAGLGTKFGNTPFGRTAPKPRAPNKTGVAKEITENNIFCPTCLPIPEGENQIQYDENGDPIGPVLSAGETKSSLPLILVATMEATEEKYSFATVFDQDSEVSGLYGIGELIRPGVAVTGIDRGMVHLRNGPSLEFLELREGEVPKKKKATGAKKKPGKKEPRKSKAYVDGSEDAINCPSENLCIVERSFVEKILANPAMLAKQARILPATENGQSTGFKLYGIRKDSLPRMIGLKNGDVLRTVNGQDLSSMDQAMGLYTKLRHASNLSVTIDRKGQTVTKEIQIK